MALATDVHNMLQDPISKLSSHTLLHLLLWQWTGLVGIGMAKMAATKAYKEAGDHGYT